MFGFEPHRRTKRGNRMYCGDERGFSGGASNRPPLLPWKQLLENEDPRSIIS